MIGQKIVDWEADDDISQMTREERHLLLLELEEKADRYLGTGIITQEKAWDMYFGLLHECDESNFPEDRQRILVKIDTKKYNPLKSSDPRIIFLARLRAIGMGLVGQN